MAQHIDLTDTHDTSTTSAPMLTQIPSVQQAKPLQTRITLLREELDTAAQNRAAVDRTLFEQDILQETAKIVAEASIWKYIIANAYLRVLEDQQGVIHGNLNILVGYIGMTPPLYTWVDCL